MRVRITIRRGSVPSAEPHLFNDVFVRQRPGWSPLLASATAHGLVLALIPTLVRALSGIPYTHTERATYTLEPLRLELPDRVYFPAARPPHPGEQSKAQEPAPARHPGQSQPAAGAGLRPQASSLRQLELPVTQHISDQAPVILQPELRMQPTPSVPAAPSLAFWTRASQPPAPRRTRPLIPGRVQEPSVSPNLDAPPVLSPSNPQPAVSDIAANLLAAQTTAKLPLPSSSTNPLRIRGKAGAEMASFDVPRSDPVDLVYLMADNNAPRQVEIPRGLRNTPRLEANGGSNLTTGHASDDGERSGSGSVGAHDRTAPGAGGAARNPEVADAAGGAAAQTPGTARAGEASRAAASNTVAAASLSQTKSAAGVNSADHPAAPPGVRAPDPAQNSGAAVIRTTHPSNGNFDVVILQSGTRDDLPDIGGTLSGNPVYTVYLSVGDAREWLLEYCIPASVNPQSTSFRVKIDDPGVVSAPYPLSTVIPRNVFELSHSKRIVLHGLLSLVGTLREVKAPNMEDPLVREVLPLLSQWQFRPALRDKVPVEVEILLIIPPRA